MARSISNNLYPSRSCPARLGANGASLRVKWITADDRLNAVERTRAAFKREGYALDATTLPDALKPMATFSFVADRHEQERVYVTIINTAERAKSKHWKHISKNLDATPPIDGSPPCRLELWRYIPHNWYVPFIGVFVGGLLLPLFIKEMPGPSASVPIIYMVAPPGTTVIAHQSDGKGSALSRNKKSKSSETSRALGSLVPAARPEQPSETPGSPARASGNGSDGDVEKNAQLYLQGALGPYITVSHFTNVKLQLTQPLAYSPGFGTATCTIDGSIESDQGTLLQSHVYDGSAAGAESTTQLINDACQDAINQMVASYRQVNPS